MKRTSTTLNISREMHGFFSNKVNADCQLCGVKGINSRFHVTNECRAFKSIRIKLTNKLRVNSGYDVESLILKTHLSKMSDANIKIPREEMVSEIKKFINGMYKREVDLE